MTLYCPFCSRMLQLTDNHAWCAICEATLTLVVSQGCVRQLIIDRCGTKCECDV